MKMISVAIALILLSSISNGAEPAQRSEDQDALTCGQSVDCLEWITASLNELKAMMEYREASIKTIKAKKRLDDSQLQGPWEKYQKAKVQPD